MMGPARLRSRAGLAAAIALVVALAAGVLAAVATVASAAVVEGARTAIAEARGAEPVVRVAIRWAGQQADDDAQAAAAASAQDAAVREVLAASMPEASLEPVTSIRSEPLALDGLSAQLVLRSDAGLVERSELTDGAWPAAADEAALHAGAAAALDLAVGDVVALPGRAESPVTVRIAGLWQPFDGLDPVWAGDPLAERGVDGLTAGPLVVDPVLWRELDTRPIAEWVAALDPARVSVAVLDEVAAAVPTLSEQIDDDERSQGTGIVVDGQLAATVAEVQRAAAGVSAVVPVAVALVAIAGVTTLLELQRLLVGVRRDETVLLRSRGASPRRLTAHAAIEAVVIALPAAAFGASGGTLAAVVISTERLTALSADPGATVTLAVLSGAAVALVTVLLATLVASRGARRALRRDTLSESGRPARAVGAVALALSGLAAGVAVSQYRLYRGPVVPTADGGAAVDPVAVLAPVLVLVAGALLAVVLIEPLARIVARAAGRSWRLTPVLVARPLARSAAIVTAPVLLMGLGVAGVTTAAAVDATTRDSERAARELTLGAPLVVSGGVLDAETRATLGAAGGPLVLGNEPFVSGPVGIAELTLADARGTLVVIAAEVLRETAAPAGGAVRPDALADAINRGGMPTLAVPETATSIRLDADGDVPAASFWLADARGGVTRVASDDDGVATLPEVGAPWRLLAADVSAEASARSLDVRLRGIVARDASGAEEPVAFAETWSPRPGVIPGFAGQAERRDDGASGFVATVERVSPGPVRVMPDPLTPGMVVTAAVAELFGLVEGDAVTARVAGSGRELTGEVSAIVSVVPGAATTAAIAVDSVGAAQSELAVSAAPLGVTALWLAPVDGAVDDETLARAADELRRLAPTAASVDVVTAVTAGALAAGARAVLWLAALGTLGLGLIAAAIVSRAIGGTREVDVVVLRAIGVGVRGQRVARALEFAGVLAAATVAGLVVGAVASALIVGDLARALLVDAPPALALTASIDPLTALVLAGGLTLALTALMVAAGMHAARQTRILSAREVLR